MDNLVLTGELKNLLMIGGLTLLAGTMPPPACITAEAARGRECTRCKCFFPVANS